MSERAGQRRCAPQRRRRVAGRRSEPRNEPPTGPAEAAAARTVAPAVATTVTAATGSPVEPAGPTDGRHAPYGLTVADVVPRGAVVGVDESHLVHTLLGAVVAAGPALIGSTSLAAVSALVATRQAVTRQLVVRLFGGELRHAADAFTGPRGVQAVVETACDVALVAGRLVDGVVWVPADVRAERLALVLAARRAYLVLTDQDDEPAPARAVADARARGGSGSGSSRGTDDDPDDDTEPDSRTGELARPWVRLGPLTAFDGVLEVAPPLGGPGRRASRAA